MKTLIRKIFIIFLLISVILVITNPNGARFLEQVAREYGTVHHGKPLDTTKLLEIGEIQTQTYFLFSLYSYRFGAISVTYIGVLGTFIKLGSERKKQQNEIKTV